MSGTSGESIPPTAVPTPVWRKLKNWIAEMEAQEARTSEPAVLTAEQRKALRSLEIAITPPLDAEPDLGSENWLSILNEYENAHPTYLDEAVENGTAPPNWIFWVAITQNEKPFPGDDTGLKPDGTPYVFASKKSAKKYAAKCAVEFLRKEGKMGRNGMDSRSATPRGAQAQELSTSAISLISAQCVPKELEGDPANSVSLGDNLVSLSSSKMLQTSRPSPPRSDETSLQAQMAKMCKDLNIDAPAYIITPDTNHAGLYKGYASFKEFLDIPEEFGHVEAMSGKPQAKEEIARIVLAELKKISEKRKAILDKARRRKVQG